MGRPLKWLSTALVLLLSACFGGTLYNQHFAHSYEFLELMAFHGGKDMRLVVSGDPYSIDDGALNRAVGAAMSGRNEGLPINFTETPQVETGPGRIEILFQPPANAIGARLCRGETKPDPNGGSADRALIVYCKRDRDLSSLWLKLPEGAVPGNQAFNDAFALAIRELLPSDPPLDRGDRCLNCLVELPNRIR